MKAQDIKRVLVVGAGTMGRQIALQCAMHGLEVHLYDVSAEALDAAQQQIAGFAAYLAGGGRLTPEQASAALGRIRFTTDPAEGAREVDLVSESAPEDPAVKGRIFAQLNALCPARTIFTTNTSTLLPSMFAGATGRPERFAALHFHQYVWVSNVVDVMAHAGTAPETVETLVGFARRIGQIPIVSRRESSGYVFNAMLSALNGAALTLASGGVADVEDVDRAWMGVMKTPIGPFGIMDLVGLDTVWSITDFWARTLNDAQLQANAAFVKGYLDRGRQGMKNGRGFYDYPDPAYEHPDFLAADERPET